MSRTSQQAHLRTIPSQADALLRIMSRARSNRWQRDTRFDTKQPRDLGVSVCLLSSLLIQVQGLRVVRDITQSRVTYDAQGPETI